ncbi:DUF4173 domain-containing protein [Streptomyces sp. NPDC050600]|uniref:DUF4153 domain-containing protein n=1 Tax=unclassified Streptomyces TaxID=2593676 RepID=UPI003437F55D
MTDTPSAQPPQDSGPNDSPPQDGPPRKGDGTPQDAPPPARPTPAATPAAGSTPGGPSGSPARAVAATQPGGPPAGGPPPGWPGGPPPPWRGAPGYPPQHPWAPPRKPRPVSKLRPPAPGPATAATLWAIVATALLAALLLGDGAGVNLLLVAVPATVAGAFAARAAGRRLRPWTLVWALGGAALLAVPALSDAGWPTFLAVVAAIGLTGFALHGGRGWPSMLLGPVGLFDSVGGGLMWVWHGVRDRADGSRGRWGPILRTGLIALGLLVVFGALFAGADAAFADLLGSLMPDISIEQAPWRTLCFLLGLLGAIAVARTAAAPLRWDRLAFTPGKPRNRLEWALPLVVLNLLFAAFNAIQLAVLFGGYDKVLSETGLTYAEYARQGFWQLLTATLLTLAVIGLAMRWAPRTDAGDRRLVRSVLGTLCVLTLVVVASALRRMDLYVDAYGLTRLRISVATMEIWLGVALLLIMAAGIWGARLLPRALAASAAGFVLVFGLIQPDAVIARQNVDRHERLGKIDVDYLEGLSADAVPALDRLPEPLRSCALVDIDTRLREDEGGWYATSLAETRAREILDARPLTRTADECDPPSREEGYDPDADPYGTP